MLRNRKYAKKKDLDMPSFKIRKGFTVVKGLLVVAALALVISAGYFIYNSMTDDETKSASSSVNTSSRNAKSYLVVKEANVKLDKSSVQGAYYKVGKNQTATNDIPGFPEVMTFKLYDSAYDNSTNIKGLKCKDVSSGNTTLATVQIIKESVRDNKYSQYKNKDQVPEDIWPSVLSDKYSTKKDGFLYQYSSLAGVQALSACASDSSDIKVRYQLNKSQDGLKLMTATLVKE